MKKPKTKNAASFFKKKFQEKGFVQEYKKISPLMDIGIAIAEARVRADLSQAELARKLKTSQSVVSRIENGNQNLSLNMLSKIALLLHCELAIKLKPQQKQAA